MRFIFSLIIVSLFLSGCATLAERGKVVDGKYIPEEFMRIRGLGSKKADFEKGKLENDTGFRIPDISLDVDKLGN